MPETHTHPCKVLLLRNKACSGWRNLPLALAFGLMAGVGAASAGGGVPNPDGLKVAILDLAELPEFAPPPPEAHKTAWRTSFGSERQTEREIKITAGQGPLAALAGIDAVLIQGVKAAAPLRRMFPPSAWRLIVSRRIIAPNDPATQTSRGTELPAATAIAVKANPTLRVTARVLSLRLDQDAHGGEPAAATAVRLSDADGRVMWLASVALPSSCDGRDVPCPALQGLEAWRKSHRDAGEPSLVGGRLAIARTPIKVKHVSSACDVHAIEADLRWKPLGEQKAENPDATSAGCISIVQLVR